MRIHMTVTLEKEVFTRLNDEVRKSGMNRSRYIQRVLNSHFSTGRRRRRSEVVEELTRQLAVAATAGRSYRMAS